MRSSPKRDELPSIPKALFISSHPVEQKTKVPLQLKRKIHPSGEILESHRYLHQADTHPPRPCFPSTQAPRSRRVSPASKLPVAPGSRLRCAGPSGSVLRPKPRNHRGLVLWPNQQTPHTIRTTSTPSFEHAKPFTSGARTVYSFLDLAAASHRLLVHDFVLLFLHHADRT